MVLVINIQYLQTKKARVVLKEKREFESMMEITDGDVGYFIEASISFGPLTGLALPQFGGGIESSRVVASHTVPQNLDGIFRSTTVLKHKTLALSTIASIERMS
jgi:hypothetical protein